MPNYWMGGTRRRILVACNKTINRYGYRLWKQIKIMTGNAKLLNGWISNQPVIEHLMDEDKWVLKNIFIRTCDWKCQLLIECIGNEPARCRGDLSRASHAQVCKGTGGLLEKKRVRGWGGEDCCCCWGEGFGCWRGGGEEDRVISTGEGGVR